MRRCFIVPACTILFIKSVLFFCLAATDFSSFSFWMFVVLKTRVIHSGSNLSLIFTCTDQVGWEDLSVSGAWAITEFSHCLQRILQRKDTCINLLLFQKFCQTEFICLHYSNSLFLFKKPHAYTISFQYMQGSFQGKNENRL